MHTNITITNIVILIICSQAFLVCETKKRIVYEIILTAATNMTERKFTRGISKVSNQKLRDCVSQTIRASSVLVSVNKCLKFNKI